MTKKVNTSKAGVVAGVLFSALASNIAQANVSEHSLYVKPSLGYTFPESVDIVDDVNVTTPDVDTDNAVSFGIALGADDVFIENLGFELELFKRSADINGDSTTTFPAGVVPFAPTGTSVASEVSGNVDIQSLMLNVSYSHPLTSKLALVVQGGIGIADVDVDTLSFNTTEVPGTSNTETAISYGAGLSYQATDRLGVELVYRHLDFGSVETDPSPFLNDAGIFLGRDHFDVEMNEITLGLKYAF